MSKQVQYVVLTDRRGEEVSRHRTDRMTYAGFTWVFKLEEERCGPLTWKLEPIEEIVE